MKSSVSGIRRIIKACIYSYQGFCAAFKSEVAFRQDLLFCLVAGSFLIFLPISGIEKAVMSLTLALILLMELVNTAIETVVDRVSPDYHELSKKAKDIGSLLVFLSFVATGIVWMIILSPLIF